MHTIQEGDKTLYYEDRRTLDGEWFMNDRQTWQKKGEPSSQQHETKPSTPENLDFPETWKG